MENQKLTSVTIKTVIFNWNFDKEWITYRLHFGRGKKNIFRIPIYIKEENTDKVNECYQGLLKFKGKEISELREKHDEIVLKYNELDFKKATK